ncbi:MAG: 3-phosphoshikimate 1-carboxyvinyltransferase [Desulfitobacteriaceae bacterium]|nr:3-phosphoshikimate 1-carboxyvinyltransferase [Desulfitobacteriaceae bacterium]MDD4753703.1 3-phosphoshikimate 1-carboxyvinyltransferase [Desulfitobacteriaceae bacterium]
MSTVKILPRRLGGEVLVPPSKSIAHRAVICAGLAEGGSTIYNLAFSQDISATVHGMGVLGAKFQEGDSPGEGFKKALYIFGCGRPVAGGNLIDCRESGSTLRFLIPLALLTKERFTFTGQGKLTTRPLNPYYEIFRRQNIKFSTDVGKLPLILQGQLKPDTFLLEGNISSQFISGLLFALPLLPDDSRVVLLSKLESRGYVELTLNVLNKFGVHVDNRDYQEFIISGKQKYCPTQMKIEGDFSQAAFWLVAATFGSNIRCLGLNKDSLQGDRAIIDIIKMMGGRVEEKEDFIQAFPARTNGMEIDASQHPDLVPIVAVLACLSQGVTRITNAARLRLKESDRLAATAQELGKLGADIREENDGLFIRGVEELPGGAVVDSWKDHRIAMALAVASIKCRSPIFIRNSRVVEKSYPNFWDHFRKLGGSIHGYDLG